MNVLIAFNAPHTRWRLRPTFCSTIPRSAATRRSTPRCSKASTRAFVGTGAEVLIPGISFDGNGVAGRLIRAAGPALGNYGVSNFLADPVLTVYRGSEIVATNDDWGVGRSAQYGATPAFFSPVGQIAAAAAANGAFAFDAGSRDAAVLVSLPAGANYTVQVSGKNDATGTALVEFYLLPPGGVP